MKAEEIQIGDWVKFGSISTQVKRLSKTLVDTTDFYEAFASELDGIQLSSDILEFNGFTVSDSGDTFKYKLSEDKYIVIKKDKENPDFDWRAAIVSRVLTCRASINKVHELQHLLRDARFDIVFKIEK